jgi:thiol-disulfide isomerase/thioredoxin
MSAEALGIFRSCGGSRIRSSLALALALCAVAVCFGEPVLYAQNKQADEEDDRHGGVLMWRNGDQLAGRLGGPAGVGAKGGPADAENAKATVVWHSELFEQPMRLDPVALKALVFNDSASQPAPADSDSAFRVVTIGGDVIDGFLVGIDEKEIRLRLPNADEGDEIAILRSAVAELMRFGADDILLYGLGGPDDWTSGDAVRPVGGADEAGTSALDSGWQLSNDGRFQSTRWRASAVRKLPEASRYVIDLRLLSFDQRPEFVIGLDGEAAHVRLETWEDELVLTSGDQFEPVLTLAGNVRDLRLMIGVDFEGKSVSVFDASGKRLAQLDFSRIEGRWKMGDSAVLLKNKGSNLELARLSVLRWDGTPGALPTLAGTGNAEKTRGKALPHRLLRSGVGAIPGELLFLEKVADKIQLVYRARSEVMRVPLSEVGILALGDRPKPSRLSGDGDSDHLSYFDGQHISGSVRRIGADHLSVKSEFSNQLIRMDLAGARQLTFSETGEPAGGVMALEISGDRLFIEGEPRLRGRVVAGEDADATFGWLSAGAAEAVTLRAEATARIVRGALPGEGESAWIRELEATDRLVLKSREIVSCRVTGIDADFVRFEQPMVKVNKLPVAMLHAVEFASARGQHEGFDDPRWRVLSETEEAVVREGNKVTLVAEGNGAIVHDGLMAGEELRFRLGFGKSGRGGALRLGLFHGGGDVSPNSTEGLNITILASGNRVWVMKAQRGQPFSFSNNGLQGIGEWPQPIRVRMVGEQLEVYVGKQKALSHKIEDEERSGHGLVFSADPMSVRYGGADSKIVIEDLVVLREKGSHAPIRVNGEAQREAVTVPRFRRGTPQEHVLIAGNGDLLRGHLVAVDDKTVVFRSRLEEVVVPRDRVAAAVWLLPLDKDGEDAKGKEPEAKAEPEPDDSKANPPRGGRIMNVVLNNGGRVHLSQPKMRGDFIEGRSEQLGECRIPLKAVREMKTSSLEVETATGADSAWYADWKLLAATEPDLPEAEGGAGSSGGATAGGGAAPAVAGAMNEDRPGPGAAAVDFELGMLGGGDFKLEEKRGRVVVIDFWATWCGPCIRAIPEYLEALKDFDEDKVQFIGVDQAEAAAEVERFMKGRKWDFDVALDSDGEVADSYGVTGIPHTVVVDAKGKIAWVHTGYTPRGAADLKEVIEGLLEKAGEGEKDLE